MIHILYLKSVSLSFVPCCLFLCHNQQSPVSVTSHFPFQLINIEMRVASQAPPITAVGSLAAGGNPYTRGKHRIQADLKRLDLESRFLQEELEQLEKMEKASSACKEMLSNVETRPDPLLPLTNGPLNPTWDRWFEGPRDSKGCRCWIL